MSNSFSNQVLAQLELWCSPEKYQVPVTKQTELCTSVLDPKFLTIFDIYLDFLANDI
jgi:S-adenosylhomocysteine hydrolase